MGDFRAEIEPGQFVLLKAVSQAANALGIRYLLTGAGGRILLLESWYGLPRGRATEDLDFGVMVRSWEEYRVLRDHLCGTLGFREDEREAQRLLYGDSAKVDLVPFGPLASPRNQVHWPSGDGMVMNVLGFQEACDSAVAFTINGALQLPVATATAMLILKFIAWEDRRERCPGKDAQDIAYILYYGAKILGEDAFYEEHQDATEAVDWDLDLASARVFGIQMGALAQSQTKKYLLRILDREVAGGTEARLVRDVAAAEPLKVRGAAHVLALIHQLKAGIIADAQP